jgi:hypothetical protein
VSRRGSPYATASAVLCPIAAHLRDTVPAAAMMGLGDRGSEMVENICRVCGLDEGEDRWTGPDGEQYIICPCCGAESGVEDIRLDWVRT